MNWYHWLCLPGAAGTLLLNSVPRRFNQEPAHYAVVINEFMPDPDPSAGLPDWPFVELKNISGQVVDLAGWTIGNGKKTAVIPGGVSISPDSLLILCPAAGAEAFAAFGTSISLTGFPALSHVSGELILSGPGDEVVDAVAYDRESFNDPVKAEGGWSLERIDAGKPCLGRTNWTAAGNALGGTPGQVNSVTEPSSSPDAGESLTRFTRSFCPDSMHVMLLLNGPVDAAAAADPSRYLFSPDAGTIADATAVLPFFDQILLTTSKPLQKQQIYRVTVSGLTGCGSAIPETALRTGIAELPDSGEMMFNEILFNPPSYGSDYIELYHSGKQIIDLQSTWLAGRDAAGALKDARPLTTIPWLLFPGDYLVVTEDAAWVESHYLVKEPGQLLQLAALPSMPDDKGTLVLLNAAGKRIDELAYDHSWQSPLLADESGVALEKMGLYLPSAQASGWTSAASTAGYGTPTYVNSESISAGYDSSRSTVSAEPAIFSPDNDGYNDFCYVTVKTKSPGYTANISLYDISGRVVRTIAASASLGSEGRFRWDGLDSSGNPLPSGRYVAFTEIFSLSGNVLRFKNSVVLARRR